MMAVVHSVDSAILQYLYALRSLPFTYFFIGVSEFGSVLTVVGLSVSLWMYLVWTKRYSYAIGLTVAIGVMGITVLLLKNLLQVPRPPVYYRAYPEDGFSFPSGHTSSSMALYGYVAYLSLRELPRKYSSLLVTLLFILIALVSISRLYLGVHYLSDVIAGFIVGISAVTLGVYARDHFTRRT